MSRNRYVDAFANNVELMSLLINIRTWCTCSCTNNWFSPHETKFFHSFQMKKWAKPNKWMHSCGEGKHWTFLETKKTVYERNASVQQSLLTSTKRPTSSHRPCRKWMVDVRWWTKKFSIKIADTSKRLQPEQFRIWLTMGKILSWMDCHRNWLRINLSSMEYHVPSANWTWSPNVPITSRSPCRKQISDLPWNETETIARSHHTRSSIRAPVQSTMEMKVNTIVLAISQTISRYATTINARQRSRCADWCLRARFSSVNSLPSPRTKDRTYGFRCGATVIQIHGVCKQVNLLFLVIDFEFESSNAEGINGIPLAIDTHQASPIESNFSFRFHCPVGYTVHAMASHWLSLTKERKIE